MKIATQSQMQHIDKWTIKNQISANELMYNAGMMIYTTITQDIKIKKTQTISILIGPGNNGGDGIVTAGLLKKNHYKNVTLYFFKNPNTLKNSPLFFYKKYKHIQNVILCETLEQLSTALYKSDIVIDAIFGTGITSPIQGIYKKAISLINHIQSKRPFEIISIDIPSGLYSDTPDEPETAIYADYTITIGLPKISLLLYPSKKHTGKLFIKNIGFSKALLTDSALSWNFYTIENAKQDIPKRIDDSYKNMYGHLPIWAGSIGKTGAAVLNSLAALKTGAGLVTLLCDETLNFIFETKLTDVMTEPFSYIDKKNSLIKIQNFIQDKSVFLVGSGLNKSQSVAFFLDHIIQFYTGTLILDADAINILSEHLNWLEPFKGKLILTPHLGEMSRLLNQNIYRIHPDIFPIIQKFAKQYNATIVLKSSNTIIFSPDSDNIYINSTGNSALSKAGSGDVLAGIIASVTIQKKEWAQRFNKKFNLLSSVLFGTWLHGRTGELLSNNINKRTIFASDLINSISDVYTELEKTNVSLY